MTSTRQLRVYVAGKIDGDPLYRQKFQEAERMLKSLGYIVLNPARHPDGMDPQDYMRIDLAMIDACDAVYFLWDWLESPGARLEMAYAEYMGKQIMGAGWRVNANNCD